MGVEGFGCEGCEVTDVPITRLGGVAHAAMALMGDVCIVLHGGLLHEVFVIEL